MNGNVYDENGRRRLLNIWYPELPPTSNKIYFKGTMLTTKARAYKESFKMYVQQNYGHELSELVEPNLKKMVLNVKQKDGTVRNEEQDFETKYPNMVFGLSLTFYTNWLTSWDDQSVAPSHRAKFRFKKIDLTNRVKLLEDCFRDAVGVDDSLTFWSTQRKVHSPDKDAVLIEYYTVPVTQFGIPEHGGLLL